MKLSVTHFGQNSDLPKSVQDQLPDDALQTKFRTALNAQLQDGLPEING